MKKAGEPDQFLTLNHFVGHLNYLGASHQVWHILVVLMFYWWHQTAIYIMNYRLRKPCPEYTASG